MIIYYCLLYYFVIYHFILLLFIIYYFIICYLSCGVSTGRVFDTFKILLVDKLESYNNNVARADI